MSMSIARNLYPGRDENAGVAGERMQYALFVGRGFQQPERGGADGDDPPPFGLGPVYGITGFGRNFAIFGVHFMVFGVGDFDRQEGAGADMEGNKHFSTPFSSSARNTRSVKCRPAVGAATAPSKRA